MIYIATPKPEWIIQSIHTVALASRVKPIEIQIRTGKMHEGRLSWREQAHWRL